VELTALVIASGDCLAVGCESSRALPLVMLIVPVLVVIVFVGVTLRERRRSRADGPEEPDQPG
jgi:hypothetical protein